MSGLIRDPDHVTAQNHARGAAVLTVKDIMTRDVITVSTETEIIQAARLLLEKRINGVPVVDEAGKLVGILCQSDLVAQQKRIPIPSLFTLLDGFMPLGSIKRLDREVENIAAIKVAHAMTPDPVTVSPDTGIEDVAALMVDKNFHTLPVVEQGKLVGIVGKQDVLRTLLEGGNGH
jgi:CBS-domain-containing membrane protein